MKADSSGRRRWSIQLSLCQNRFSILDGLKNPSKKKKKKGMPNTLDRLKYLSITHNRLHQNLFWGRFELHECQNQKVQA